MLCSLYIYEPSVLLTFLPSICIGNYFYFTCNTLSVTYKNAITILMPRKCEAKVENMFKKLKFSLDISPCRLPCIVDVLNHMISCTLLTLWAGIIHTINVDHAWLTWIPFTFNHNLLKLIV